MLKKEAFFPILSFSHKTKFKAPLHGPPKQGCLGSLQELKSRFGGEQREREHHASIFQMWKPKKAQGFSEAVNKKDGKEKRPSLEKYNDTQLSIKKLREALLSSRSLLGVRDFIS